MYIYIRNSCRNDREPRDIEDKRLGVTVRYGRRNLSDRRTEPRDIVSLRLINLPCPTRWPGLIFRYAEWIAQFSVRLPSPRRIHLSLLASVHTRRDTPRGKWEKREFITRSLGLKTGVSVPVDKAHRRDFEREGGAKWSTVIY